MGRLLDDKTITYLLKNIGRDVWQWDRSIIVSDVWTKPNDMKETRGG